MRRALQKTIHISVILLAFLLFVLGLTAMAFVQEWDIQVVDSEGIVGSFSSTVLDSNVS